MLWATHAFSIILDAVRFVLAEYGRVAMHGGPVHASFMSAWLSENVKFDVGEILCLIRLVRPICSYRKASLTQN